MSSSVDTSTGVVNNRAPRTIDADRRPSDRGRVSNTAERIRRLIETRGMSARSLSEAAGLSHSTVSSLLAKLDANPDARVEARTLDKIAAALKVDATWLRTGRDEMDSNASTPAVTCGRSRWPSPPPSRRCVGCGPRATSRRCG